MTVQALPQQRDVALERANVARTASAEYKRRIASGEIPLEQAVRECDLPIKVHHLLQAAPRWGGTKATAAIRRANLTTGDICFTQTTRYRGITPDERERLAQVVSGTPAITKVHPRLLDDLQKSMIARRMERCGCSLTQIRSVVER